MRTAVTKADRYEPVPNATYLEMATHYQMTVLPARPYHPRDKPKVEVAVLVVERWILARLRNRHFHSLEEANAEIVKLTWDLNHRVTKSRQELFETIERDHLRPLPATPYEFATWRRAKVSIDYHIIVSGDRHYYLRTLPPGRHPRRGATVREECADLCQGGQSGSPPTQ